MIYLGPPCVIELSDDISITVDEVAAGDISGVNEATLDHYLQKNVQYLSKVDL